tara:strand:+ start:597 stop:1052 length:456 start_codon:yes stop_codon:yes gene_type:complete
MSKKIKSYNLSKDVIQAINDKANVDGRKDSDWLNRFLTMELITKTSLQLNTDNQSVVKRVLLPAIVAAIPDGLNIAAWERWVEFRKKAKFKKYKTDAAMKKLAKMGTQNEQYLIVQQSIDNEYQGLFAIKGNNSTGKTSGNLSACEDFING